MKFFIKNVISGIWLFRRKANREAIFRSQKAWFYFPSFKDKILNPKEFVTFKINEFEYFTLEFVWHNSSLILKICLKEEIKIMKEEFTQVRNLNYLH